MTTIQTNSEGPLDWLRELLDCDLMQEWDSQPFSRRQLAK